MAKKKIYWDFGHGGTDPGGTGNGLQEKNVVLEIGKYIKEMMENYEDVECKFSRLSDKSVSLNQRTNEANAWGADLLVSVHTNAFNGLANGFESFIYNGSYNGKSRTQAFQNTMHSKIMAKCKFFYDRGKKQGNLHMCRESAMPAILTESGFIDNKKDAAAMKDRAKLIAIAAGHVEGVAAFLGLKEKATQKPAPKPAPATNSSDTVYRVVTGSFSSKKNAEERAAALKAKGFDSFIDAYKK
jgi:N-acetylmuramoyl-L-alanine amidase